MNPFLIAGVVWVIAAVATMVYQAVCRRQRSQGDSIGVSWRDSLTSSIAFGFLFAAVAFFIAGIVALFV